MCVQLLLRIAGPAVLLCVQQLLRAAGPAAASAVAYSCGAQRVLAAHDVCEVHLRSLLLPLRAAGPAVLLLLMLRKRGTALGVCQPASACRPAAAGAGHEHLRPAMHPAQAVAHAAVVVRRAAHAAEHAGSSKHARHADVHRVARVDLWVGVLCVLLCGVRG